MKEKTVCNFIMYITLYEHGDDGNIASMTTCGDTDLQ